LKQDFGGDDPSYIWVIDVLLIHLLYLSSIFIDVSIKTYLGHLGLG